MLSTKDSYRCGLTKTISLNLGSLSQKIQEKSSTSAALVNLDITGVYMVV